MLVVLLPAPRVQSWPRGTDPGDIENKCHITKGPKMSVVLLPASHVCKVSQGEYIQATLRTSITYRRGPRCQWCCYQPHMCAKSAEKNASKRHWEPASHKQNPKHRWCCYQPHMCAKLTRGNTSKRHWEPASHNEGAQDVSGAVTSATCVQSRPRGTDPGDAKNQRHITKGPKMSVMLLPAPHMCKVSQEECIQATLRTSVT